MAPKDFQQQTADILYYLFNDDDMIETDGDEGIEKKIAEKLKQLGDDYDEKVIQPLIQPLMQHAQRAAKDQVAVAFGDAVDGLCKTWVMTGAEVSSEKQLLKASVAIGLYMKKNCPSASSVIVTAMQSFFNQRLAGWVSQQGGWEQATSC